MGLYTVNRIKKEQKEYFPDLTWANCWTLLRYKKNSPIILSCKKCVRGVSPNSGKPMEALRLLLSLIHIWYFISLRSHFFSFVETVFPRNESNVVKEIISGLMWFSCLFAIVLIVLFLFLRFMKWVPAEMNHKQSRAINNGDDFPIDL